MNEITLAETQRLEVLEATIERGMQTFVDVGNALLEIRDSRLYRQEFSTFEDYCRERWGIERRRAYQLMDAAQVVGNLDVNLGTQIGEKHLRPLTTLEPEQQREVWQRAVETAPNGKVTAAHVQSVTFEIRQERIAKEEQRERQREVNAERIANTPDLSTIVTTYSTILIDPPWDWGDEGDVDQFGRARPTYQTLTFEELLALPVSSLADTNCHLYLWITNRSLPKGFALLNQWGFRYITCITWVKPSFGMGNYFRGQTEHILFGVRGSLPLLRRNAPTVINANRGPNGHSSKPLEIYEFIESCSPGPYIEMFARHVQPGWHAWGEVTNGLAV